MGWTTISKVRPKVKIILHWMEVWNTHDLRYLLDTRSTRAFVHIRMLIFQRVKVDINICSSYPFSSIHRFTFFRWCFYWSIFMWIFLFLSNFLMSNMVWGFIMLKILEPCNFFWVLFIYIIVENKIVSGLNINQWTPVNKACGSKIAIYIYTYLLKRIWMGYHCFLKYSYSISYLEPSKFSIPQL